jgi:hypothetical protein
MVCSPEYNKAEIVADFSGQNSENMCLFVSTILSIRETMAEGGHTVAYFHLVPASVPIVTVNQTIK